LDDRTLVESAQRGSREAFAVLVAGHERSLYGTALSLSRSSLDASDALQDAFVEAFVKLRKLRDPGKFGPWVSAILVNKCRDARRRNRTVPTDALLESQAYEFAGPETSLDLLDALRDLDEQLRVVVALRYFRDLKVDEIAEIVGCPSGTVKSRLNRAIAALHERLERGHPLDLEVML
jgi:RNA polymerase sigma-70 factor (ECF subfamily)